MGEVSVRFVTRLMPLLFAAAACGGTEDPTPVLSDPDPESPSRWMQPSPEEPGPTTFRERLAEGVPLTLDAASPIFQINVAPSDAEPIVASSVIAMSGAASARVDDRARVLLQTVTFDVADIEVGAEKFPPYGVHITDVHVEVGPRALATEWSADGSAANFSGVTTLRVSWTLIGRGGNRVPLRPIETEALEVEGSLLQDSTGASIFFAARATGRLVHVTDLVDLSDLSFQLRLDEAAATR
jgi:hypothetical protein